MNNFFYKNGTHPGQKFPVPRFIVHPGFYASAVWGDVQIYQASQYGANDSRLSKDKLNRWHKSTDFEKFFTIHESFLSLIPYTVTSRNMS